MVQKSQSKRLATKLLYKIILFLKYNQSDAPQRQIYKFFFIGGSNLWFRKHYWNVVCGKLLHPRYYGTTSSTQAPYSNDALISLYQFPSLNPRSDITVLGAQKCAGYADIKGHPSKIEFLTYAWNLIVPKKCSANCSNKSINLLNLDKCDPSNARISVSGHWTHLGQFLHETDVACCFVHVHSKLRHDIQWVFTWGTTSTVLTLDVFPNTGTAFSRATSRTGAVTQRQWTSWWL